MTRLVLVYEIDDQVDPTLVYPHEVVDAIEECKRPSGSIAESGVLGDPFRGHRYRFVAADWESGAESLIADVCQPQEHDVDVQDLPIADEFGEMP